MKERDINNVPTTTYTRGKDLSGSLESAGGIGGLLARTDANGPTYYHADGNGNITMLINSSQAIVAKYLYDAFGNVLSASGLLANANLYQFSSKERHLNSGLDYYLYRYYDPNLQRWPNRDPLEEVGFDLLSGLLPDPDPRANLGIYLFVANNPACAIDLYGLEFYHAVKAMARAVKKAADEYEEGKCPADPCKLPSSLNAAYTCMYNAAKNKNLDQMAGCACQLNPLDDDREKKVKKILYPLYGKHYP